jgi:2-methylcitrate dehydratase
LQKDVQDLLQKVQVNQKKEYSDRFPNEMPFDISITLKDGTVLEIEKKDYQGFLTRPASWELIVEKFNNLAAPFADEFLREKIITMVEELENYHISELMALLEKVGTTASTQNLKLSNI